MPEVGYLIFQQPGPLKGFKSGKGQKFVQRIVKFLSGSHQFLRQAIAFPDLSGNFAGDKKKISHCDSGLCGKDLAVRQGFSVDL